MIVIPRSQNADTRSCDFSKVQQDELYRNSHQHINDVRRALLFFKYLLDDAAQRHDYDKLLNIESFHNDFVTGFNSTKWWDKHRKLNRHHLNNEDGVPYDVNLIDILDMIADCTVAGMARSGEVYSINISPEVLMKAFNNTCKLLLDQVKVVDAKP